MSNGRPDIRIAGDVGGTFTDLVMVRGRASQVFMTKVRSTPADPSLGFAAGVEKLLAMAGYAPADVGNVLFASTAAINAVLERSGARMGLLVTKGFRHILEIARANIPGRLTSELTYVRPERLILLERVHEVDERCTANGEVLRALDESSAREAIRTLLGQGVESIAVCLLHSYANPRHEQRVRELIAEEDPRLLVSISSDVVPEYREYERTVTTVLNAYVMPVMDRTLRGVQVRLRDAGLNPALGVVRCDGGIMSAEAAIQTPVNTILSGPAGGVYGAAYVAQLAGYDNVISLDMGGTSTDVSLTAGGKARITSDTMISEYPVKIPVMDIETIGAGGGSVAYVSSTGALHVGPKSAGADPGPVCYDQGGTEITVTDANLLLGRIPPYLVGGEIALNLDKARSAMEALAKKLTMDPMELAQGILTIVNEKMLGAIRIVSVQRGYDPSDFVLIPFGGAGPVHSGELCRLLGLSKALIPPAPGVLSAVGALVSDITGVFGTTWIQRADQIAFDDANQILDDLADKANAWLTDEGIPAEERELVVRADLRYAGQATELSVPTTQPLNQQTVDTAIAAFHDEHKRVYGFDWRGLVPVELVALKVTGVGRVNRPDASLVMGSAATTEDGPITYRQVYFDGGFERTPCYQRGHLAVSRQVVGPAIIEQLDCTTVILPGQTAVVDRSLNLVVEEAR